MEQNISQLLEEGLVSMGAAATILGSVRGGKPIHPATISRWGRLGIRLPDGTVLRLETITLNGRQSTTRQAVIRFISRQQGQEAAPNGASAKRSKASEAAAAELDRLGVR